MNVKIYNREKTIAGCSSSVKEPAQILFLRLFGIIF